MSDLEADLSWLAAGTCKTNLATLGRIEAVGQVPVAGRRAA